MAGGRTFLPNFLPPRGPTLELVERTVGKRLSTRDEEARNKNTEPPAWPHEGPVILVELESDFPFILFALGQAWVRHGRRSLRLV